MLKKNKIVYVEAQEIGAYEWEALAENWGIVFASSDDSITEFLDKYEDGLYKYKLHSMFTEEEIQQFLITQYYKVVGDNDLYVEAWEWMSLGEDILTALRETIVDYLSISNLIESIGESNDYVEIGTVGYSPWAYYINYNLDYVDDEIIHSLYDGYDFYNLVVTNHNREYITEIRSRYLPFNKMTEDNLKKEVRQVLGDDAIVRVIATSHNPGSYRIVSEVTYTIEEIKK